MGKDKPGTSPFTVQDDLGADLHTANADHFDSLHYGAPVPPKNELKEVVFGPGAYGSPDPRSLGHQLVTDGAEQVKSPSALPLDPEFAKAAAEAGGGTAASSGTSEKKSYSNMSKAELLAEAEAQGLDVTEENTKDEIKAALENA